MNQRRAQIGDTVEIQAQARVIEVAEEHGLSYKVVLPKGDYLYPRTIWLEPSECHTQPENKSK